MRNTVASLLSMSLVAAFAASPLPAFAGSYGLQPPYPNAGIAGPTGAPSGRAPWNAPYEYDSGSDNDRRPELPYYQQGRGQQTGGPARNLLPDDGIHLFPR